MFESTYFILFLQMTVQFLLSHGSHLLKSIKQKEQAWLVCVPRIDAGRAEAREGSSVIHCRFHGWDPRFQKVHKYIYPKEKRTHQVYTPNLLEIRFSNWAMFSVSLRASSCVSLCVSFPVCRLPPPHSTRHHFHFCLNSFKLLLINSMLCSMYEYLNCCYWFFVF